MADKKIVVDVLINTADSANNIKDIKKSINELTEATKEFGDGSEEFTKLNKKADELSDKLNDVGAAGKKSQGGLSAVSKGFSGIGLAIKAAGIGLVIGLFSALKDILMQQQPVIDAVDTAMTAINLTIQALIKAVTDAYESTAKLTGGFDASKKVIGALITIGLAPLKLIIQEIRGAIAGAQLLWEQSFLGDGDPDKIKKLESTLNNVSDKTLAIGKDVLNAGKTIGANIGEAISEVGTLTEAVIDNVSKIDGQAILSAAKAATKLKNSSELAIAANQGLIDSYERQIELQKQIRDDDTKNINDRIIANTKIGDLLNEENKKLLANADLKIQSAQADLASNNNNENKVKLQDAINAKAGINAQIEGKRSEQIQNRINLEKQLDTITKTRQDGELSRANSQRDFDNNLIQDNVKKLSQQLDNIKIDKEAFILAQQAKIDATEQNTQARTDLEEELKNKIIEFDQDRFLKKRELAAAEQEVDDKLTDEILANRQKLADEEKKKRDDTLTAISKYANEFATILNDGNKNINSNFISTLSGISSAIGAFAEIAKQKFEKVGEKIAAYAVAALSAISSILTSVQENNKVKLEEQLKSVQESQTAELDVVKQKNAEEQAALDEKYSKNLITKEVYDAQTKALAEKKASDDLGITKKFDAKSLELKKKAFEQDKKLRIAQAIIAGITGAVTAFTSAMSLGPIAGPIVGAILAATVGIMTAVNVSKIKKQQFDGGDSSAGGGGIPGIGGGMAAAATPNMPATKLNDFSLFGTAGTRNNKSADKQSNEVRAYVVESDVTRTQRRVASFRTNSEL